MSTATVNSIITNILSILNDKLEDPYCIAGGRDRTWAHKDQPLSQATYPRIQVTKGKKDNEIISMSYSKQRTGIFNIFFYTKKGFKITVDGTEYLNESLCEYMSEQIEDIIDTHRDTITGTWGCKISTSDEPIFIAPESMYVIMVNIRLFWFKVET